MDILEKLGHSFPQNEASYRHMEQLLIRENVLDSTLRELSHVRGFGSNPHAADQQQRYWVADEDAATEWFSAAETEEVYAQTDGEPYEDDFHSDGDSTSSSQWQNENLLDPYDETKLATEYQRAPDEQFVVIGQQRDVSSSEATAEGRAKEDEKGRRDSREAR
eukprot:3982044-Amphidinium_carterae.1